MRATTPTRSRLLWTLLPVILAGCQNTPRNGQTLPNASDPVQWAGYTNNKNLTLSLQARNFQVTSPTYRTLATTTSSNTASLDAVGGKWYAYARNVTIPFGRSASQLQLWKSADTIAGQRRIKAETRTFTSAEGAYYTFDMADNDCIQAHESEGGLGIISACDAEGERAATVFVNCGKRGQACCLGFNVFDSVWCDSGVLCDATTNTCTVEAGGLGEPCKDLTRCDDLSSGHSLQCMPGPSVQPSAGTCRDLTVEHTPVVTADLTVHTCNLTNAASVSDRFVGIGTVGWEGTPENLSLPRTKMQWLSRPHEVVAVDKSNTYGLRIDGLDTLADITKLSLNLGGVNRNDAWCFDYVRLDVNGLKVFDKTLPPTWMDSDTGVTYVTVATQEELRAAYVNLKSTDHCHLPTDVTPAQLRRQVEGALGDLMTRARVGDTISVPQAYSVQMRWGSNGNVNVTGSGDGQGMKVDVTMHARELYSPFHFSGDASFSVTVRPDCDSSVTRWLPNHVIDQCSTDYLADIGLGRITVDLDDEIGGLLDGLIPVDEVAKVLVNAAANDIAGSVVADTLNFGSMFDHAEDELCSRREATGILCDSGGELCGCPALDFSDAGVHLGWTHFGPNNLDLPSFDPNLACLQ